MTTIKHGSPSSSVREGSVESDILTRHQLSSSEAREKRGEGERTEKKAEKKREREREKRGKRKKGGKTKKKGGERGKKKRKKDVH